MAINDQMEMALSSPAPRVDPVSGNEVPPGSLPVEVRDDIDVNLSEGEYVVPADVLRFHGVKFFEDLRAEAKMGLSGMESEGRIGGEPVESAPMDPAAMGISEDDIAMLEQALGGGEIPANALAKGGLMDKVAFTALNDPLVNERINSKGMAVGFAEGGMTQSLYSDPTRIDSLIDKVMSAAQNNPSLLGELSKRGVTVNTTKADMKPAEMQQANTQPVGLAEGGPLINAPLGFSGDMGTAPSIPSGGTGFNPFEYGLGFSSFGKTTPAGYTPAVVAPTVAGGALGLAAPAPADPYAGQRGGVAVGQMMPNGKTRMPDEYYMGGGRSDEKRTMAALAESEGADLRLYSYGDKDKLFSETMAAAKGENNPLEKLANATGKFSLFAAGEYVNLKDNITQLKALGASEEQLTAATEAVEAKKKAELGDNPGFLAKAIISLGSSGRQAARIAEAFPVDTSTFSPRPDKDRSYTPNRKGQTEGEANTEAFRKAGGGSQVGGRGGDNTAGSGTGQGFIDRSTAGGNSQADKDRAMGGNSTNPRTKSKNYDSAGRYTGPMNKGGLMAKKKTKKK